MKEEETGNLQLSQPRIRVGCKSKPKVVNPRKLGTLKDNIQIGFFPSFRKGLFIYFYIMCLQLVFWGRVSVFLFFSFSALEV